MYYILYSSLSSLSSLSPSRSLSFLSYTRTHRHTLSLSLTLSLRNSFFNKLRGNSPHTRLWISRDRGNTLSEVSWPEDKEASVHFSLCAIHVRKTLKPLTPPLVEADFSGRYQWHRLDHCLGRRAFWWSLCMQSIRKCWILTEWHVGSQWSHRRNAAFAEEYQYEL